MPTITILILSGVIILICVHIFQQPNPSKTALQIIGGLISEFALQIALPLLLAGFLIFLNIMGCFGQRHGG